MQTNDDRADSTIWAFAGSGGAMGIVFTSIEFERCLPADSVITSANRQVVVLKLAMIA